MQSNDHSKQFIRVVNKDKNRIHYFEFFDFETIGDLKKSLIKKYNYPNYITVFSKHSLEDNEKIVDCLKDTKELNITFQEYLIKSSKDHKIA